jgi:hypothetical protein
MEGDSTGDDLVVLDDENFRHISAP